MPTQEKIEEAYKVMQERYSKKRGTESTGMQNVLQLMVDHPERIWWWSWEINGKTTLRGDWISHRGCARASDLAIQHPELVEDRKVGRFCIYRAKTENLHEIEAFLSDNP